MAEWVGEDMALELFDVFIMLTLKFICLYLKVSVGVIGILFVIMLIREVGTSLYYRWRE